MSCCAAGGSAAGGAPGGGAKARPNIIITGTGRVAAAGVTSVIWISTVIAGYAVLSTCPTNCFSMTVWGPAVVLVVLATVQATLGASAGTRPSTSRSKSST